jgi:DNA-binding GntR family transcriptional regulator
VTLVIRPPTLTAATAKNIEASILRGDFAPGDPLREADLSERLGVSRGTVREAIRLLHQQGGLVEVIPHKGAFVVKLSLERAREIYTLRALLESYAVRICMESQSYDEGALQELERLLVRIEDLEKEGNVPALVEADMDFHRFATGRCNHQLLLEMVNNLHSQTMVLIFNTKLYRSDKVPDSVSHRAIVDGLRAGDPVAAEAIMRNHIIDAGSWLVNAMEEARRGEAAQTSAREGVPETRSGWPGWRTGITSAQ